MFGLFAGDGQRGTLTVVFNGVGWGEIVVLLLIGLFVFGPDRLPKAARDAGRMLRQFRQMANGMRNDLRSELGPELADLDIRDLHPKTFVRKHLFEPDDEPLLPPYLTKRTSLDALLMDDEPPAAPSLTKTHVPSAGTDTKGRSGRPSLVKPTTATGRPGPAGEPDARDARAGDATGGAGTAARPERVDPPPFDLDAT